MEKLYSKIDAYIDKKNIPNFIFYGTYLCGKEKLCDYLIQKIYCDVKDRKKYLLRINCVSTKGIKMIKENIKLFSMQIMHKTDQLFHKTIILEHCNYLTYDSQYSLRRTIEQFCNNTRFIMICDNLENLLSPILSRFVHIYVNIKESRNCIIKNYGAVNKIYDKFLTIVKEDGSLKDLFDLAKESSEKCISVDDILFKFRGHVNFSLFQAIYDKVRINYNNDVLVYYYMFSLFRRKQELEIYDLY